MEMGVPKTLLEFQATPPPDDRVALAVLAARAPEAVRPAHPPECLPTRGFRPGTARGWFLAIFFVARHKHGISALQFQRDSGIGSYQTACNCAARAGARRAAAAASGS